MYNIGRIGGVYKTDNITNLWKQILILCKQSICKHNNLQKDRIKSNKCKSTTGIIKFSFQFLLQSHDVIRVWVSHLYNMRQVIYYFCLADCSNIGPSHLLNNILFFCNWTSFDNFLNISYNILTFLDNSNSSNLAFLLQG